MAGFEVWFKGGTSLSKGFNLIERFSDYADPQTLAAEMLAQKQIAVLPTSSDPALSPADGPRWELLRRAHTAIGHMFWRRRPAEFGPLRS